MINNLAWRYIYCDCKLNFDIFHNSVIIIIIFIFITKVIFIWAFIHAHCSFSVKLPLHPLVIAYAEVMLESFESIYQNYHWMDTYYAFTLVDMLC